MKAKNLSEAEVRMEREIQMEMPMRYSKANTGIRFQYDDVNNPLQGLNLVEESLISLISVVVIIRTVEGT